MFMHFFQLLNINIQHFKHSKHIHWHFDTLFTPTLLLPLRKRLHAPLVTIVLFPCWPAISDHLAGPFRYPRVSRGEGAPVADDDQPAVGPEGAAAGRPLGAEEHGCPAAGEAAATDGACAAAAGAGTHTHKHTLLSFIILLHLGSVLVIVQPFSL